ncbi:hypothetical protein N499_0689B, partial [Wolbachia pipientis wVitA]
PVSRHWDDTICCAIYLQK